MMSLMKISQLYVKQKVLISTFLDLYLTEKVNHFSLYERIYAQITH